MGETTGGLAAAWTASLGVVLGWIALQAAISVPLAVTSGCVLLRLLTRASRGGSAVG
jgi:hypothetical protein